MVLCWLCDRRAYVVGVYMKIPVYDEEGRLMAEITENIKDTRDWKQEIENKIVDELGMGLPSEDCLLVATSVRRTLSLAEEHWKNRAIKSADKTFDEIVQPRVDELQKQITRLEAENKKMKDLIKSEYSKGFDCAVRDACDKTRKVERQAIIEKIDEAFNKESSYETTECIMNLVKELKKEDK